MRWLNFFNRRTLAACVTLLPSVAYSHAPADGELHHWWTLDPWIVTPLLLFTSLYAGGLLSLRRNRYAGSAIQPLALAGAIGGASALFLALIWPLDVFSESSFAAHMAQHMLLIAVAGPLLALGRVSVPINATISTLSSSAAAALSLPRKWIRILLLPSVVFILHGAVIWIWHAPLPFELALRIEWVHTLEHLCFLIAGYWYWAILIRHVENEGYAAASLSILSTLMHTGLLGALITFAPRPLYATYVTTQGSVEAALQDQQLAGLLMWIPMGACYLVGGLAFAAAWLRNVDKHRERPTS